MEWAVYYDDRALFTSEDGPWLDAPAWGVQAVVVSAMPVQERIIFHGDFAFIPARASLPFAGDEWGVIDKLLYEGHMTVDQTLSEFTPSELIGWGFKFGRMMDTPDYLELERFINADARLRFPELVDGSMSRNSRHTGGKAWAD